MNDINSVLLDAMEIIVDNQINNLKKDETYDGIIVSKSLSNGKYLYEVSVVSTIIKVSNEAELDIGAKVLVTFPLGDSRNAFFNNVGVVGTGGTVDISPIPISKIQSLFE